jgi:uncharacterized protein (DUF305 family)
MKLHVTIAGFLLVGLAGCSPEAQAPASSGLSAQDLNSLTAAYDLVQFDLSECAQLPPTDISPQTTMVSQKVCADATGYKTKIQALAVARGVTLPAEMSYDMRVRSVAMTYHPSPNVTGQYLRDAIESHQEALLIFRDETTNGQDQEIMAFDATAIPIVQENLNALQAAQTAAN